MVGKRASRVSLARRSKRARTNTPTDAALTQKILHFAGRPLTRLDFLRKVLQALGQSFGCDELELRLSGSSGDAASEVAVLRGSRFSFYIQNGASSPSPRCSSPWACVPLTIGGDTIGQLRVRSEEPTRLARCRKLLQGGIAQTLGVTLVSQRVQAALRERVKELTCLYGIAKLSEKPEASLDQILQGIVELLPPAWQYPEITSARIEFDGHSYRTAAYQDSPWRQSAEIVVSGRRHGSIEVVYSRRRPTLDEGPFLKEERSLIGTLASQVALIIEQKRSEEDKTKLQEQLRHADRLATIGQLAAGVAHELNEPLSNILGFAQLVKKSPALPAQSGQDLDKIVSASLHAREVIKKLMLFARQMPPGKARVNLNQLVEEGLYFFETRCQKAGIELVRVLAPGLPEITADSTQLNQVLVNLVVNAIQAMPEGGKLTVQTQSVDGHVALVVEDTGIGMSREVLRHIFVPFFTTKDVNEGTGLGLSVVHGIVTSHRGTIEVRSRLKRGTTFEIRLPIDVSGEGQ